MPDGLDRSTGLARWDGAGAGERPAGDESILKGRQI